MHNNIMNRNIDLLLKKNNNRSTQPSSNLKASRINKYELAYGRKTTSTTMKDHIENQLSFNQKQQQFQNKFNNNEHKQSNGEMKLMNNNQFNIPLIKRDEFDRDDEKQRNKISLLDNKRNNQLIDTKNRLSTDNSFDEISEANNSQTNSISSNTSYLKFDVKSQPLMSFQSIAYVQANRLNSNSQITNQTSTVINQTITSSSNKLMNLGGSNTSSTDLPVYRMMGESLDDSSLDTARIQDICNLSTSSTTDDELRESIKSSESDDATLIDEINMSSFNASFD